MGRQERSDRSSGKSGRSVGREVGMDVRWKIDGNSLAGKFTEFGDPIVATESLESTYESLASGII